MLQRLKSLHIDSGNEENKQIVPKLGSAAVNIQFLTIKGADHEAALCTRSNLPTLRGLTHIHWGTRFIGIPIGDLVTFFSTSPQLEVIKMHIPVLESKGQVSLNGASLPKLCALDWEDYAGLTSLALHTSVPELRELKIKLTGNHQTRWATRSLSLPEQTPLL